jgi:chromosome segregation ATPase
LETLQGEVEQISLMKPKAQGPHDEGFLEYLEDIIGTNQYVEKIDEAFKQCVKCLNVFHSREWLFLFGPWMHI